MSNNNINTNNIDKKKPRRRKRKRHSKHKNKYLNNNNVQKSDNIHISTEELVSNSSHSSNSNMSFSSLIANKTNTQISPVPGSQNPNMNIHQNLSKSELENIHIREKKICFLRHLPLYLCDKNILSSTDWFGQFVPRQVKLTLHKQQAHIIYETESNAEKAIQFAKNKGLLANFGTKKYCEIFLDGKRCEKYYCTYAHKWCKQDEIVSMDSLYKKKDYKIQSSVGTNVMKILENENEDLRNKCKELQVEVKKWKLKHEVLNENHEVLQDKYKKLERKSRININIYKYKSWTCEQVYEWINSNDGKKCTCFSKFANQLFYKNMKNEGIDGSCLPDLQEHDIHRLGITHFKAKKCLIKCINNLIIKNSTTNYGDKNGKKID